MRYHIVTNCSGDIGNSVCTIEAVSPRQALMLVDGIEYAREWPYSDDGAGGGMLADPDDPARSVSADPMS